MCEKPLAQPLHVGYPSLATKSNKPIEFQVPCSQGGASGCSRAYTLCWSSSLGASCSHLRRSPNVSGKPVSSAGKRDKDQKLQPKHARRSMSFLFTTAAVILALASAAFACTTYKGRFEVSGGNGYTPQTAVAKGGNTGMSFCSSPPTATFGGSNRPAFYANVSPSTSSGTCTASQLQDSPSLAPYNVTYQTGAFSTGDCMSGQAGNQLVGTMAVRNGYSVNANLQWSWYAYPQTGYTITTQPGAGSVCVSDSSATQGMQIPVNVV